jgi:hypothetical protein
MLTDKSLKLDKMPVTALAFELVQLVLECFAIIHDSLPPRRVCVIITWVRTQLKRVVTPL